MSGKKEQPQLESVTSSLTDNGYYLFMQVVNGETIKPVIEWIMQENFSKKPREFLTLVICSPGGDFSVCMALIDTMKSSKIPIHTVGLGMIASCGLLMFITGEKGHRILTPNTSILSHQYSWGSRGKEHELFATVKEFELTGKRLINHYKKCTGLSEVDIKKYLLPPQDVWLNAKEAKKHGLCDKIKEVY